MAEDLNLKRL